MVSAVDSSSVPTLEGRIRQDQMQLNDWTTCVSAKTPKGQAAIQKLSGEISADKAQIARAQLNQSAVPAGTQNHDSVSTASGAGSTSRSVDVWA